MDRYFVVFLFIAYHSDGRIQLTLSDMVDAVETPLIHPIERFQMAEMEVEREKGGSNFLSMTLYYLVQEARA